MISLSQFSDGRVLLKIEGVGEMICKDFDEAYQLIQVKFPDNFTYHNK